MWVWLPIHKNLRILPNGILLSTVLSKTSSRIGFPTNLPSEVIGSYTLYVLLSTSPLYHTCTMYMYEIVKAPLTVLLYLYFAEAKLRQNNRYNGTVRGTLTITYSTIHCHGNHFLNPEK